MGVARGYPLFGMSVPPDATGLLRRLCEGDLAARDEFAPILHEELKKLAKHHLAREHGHHTLAPTELVHDAWMRLIRPEVASFESRRQFFALASQMMRSLLVDHARKRRAERRGGGVAAIALTSLNEPSHDDPGQDVLMLDDALSRLAEIDEELGRIAELKIFGGIEMTDLATHFAMPLRTAERRWTAARVWLQKELRDG
jgi:RNA polymerase sigma factor (TIGR02999 family)